MKYEYKVVTGWLRGKTLEATINAVAQDGWRLVQAAWLGEDFGSRFFYERPLREVAKQVDGQDDALKDVPRRSLRKSRQTDNTDAKDE